MLYLEDFMEMIENLPMEMRDRFTEMREMDLQVQNAMDSIEERIRKFFEKCNSNNNLKQEWKDDQFKKIKEEYERALEDADEKVQLAAQIHDLLERYQRKLDMELQKFKLELEADNAGITERLEKRSLEMDNPPAGHSMRGEKRKYSQMNSTSAHHHYSSDKRLTHSVTSDKLLSLTGAETQREKLYSQRSSLSATNSPASHMFGSISSAGSTPALSYNLGHVGAGSNAAIAAAAARAIGATAEMSQGRRTSSLKNSYEAIKNVDINQSLRTYGLATSTTRVDAGASQSSAHKASRKKSAVKGRTTQHATHQSQLAQQLQQPTPAVADFAEVTIDDPTRAWDFDPNETR